MAKVKNISGVDRLVPSLNGRRVLAGQVVDVPDEDADSFTCQDTTWRAVTTTSNEDGAK